MKRTKNKRLGVNIDHIATLRQARGSLYPDPVLAIQILESCGVEQVTIHLREDRRHIQDHDLKRILQVANLPVNLELAVTAEMIKIAARHKPHTATFVPERRSEVTTEGGLDCKKHFRAVKNAVQTLQAKQIRCSLFIDPDVQQVKAAAATDVEAIEIHTGKYCEEVESFYRNNGHHNYLSAKKGTTRILREYERIKTATQKAKESGLLVFAGHGLHTGNLQPITKIHDIEEYNIGHAIISRAVFIGLKNAIQEIQSILKK